MNRILAIAEWRRAQAALRAAGILKTEESADAVSRAYYAVFHAAKAALATKGIAAETHRAVRSLFSLHLVKPGIIEKSFSRLVDQCADERITADYDAEVVISNKQARHECNRARLFLSRIRRYLLEQGFRPGELRRKKK